MHQLNILSICFTSSYIYGHDGASSLNTWAYSALKQRHFLNHHNTTTLRRFNIDKILWSNTWAKFKYQWSQYSLELFPTLTHRQNLIKNYRWIWLSFLLHLFQSRTAPAKCPWDCIGCLLEALREDPFSTCCQNSVLYSSHFLAGFWMRGSLCQRHQHSLWSSSSSKPLIAG